MLENAGLGDWRQVALGRTGVFLLVLQKSLHRERKMPKPEAGLELSSKRC